MKKILYGLTLETGKILREALECKLTESGQEILTICRYRKEGIYQYAKTQENLVLILNEKIQASNSYSEEELSQLADCCNHKIILLLDRQHYGSDYMKILYVCGIQGVYLDDMTPKRVLELIEKSRTNEEAREYYGIHTLRDTEKMLNVANENLVGDHLEFIEAGSSVKDIDERYQFSTTRLCTAENEALVRRISASAVRLLQGNKIFHSYRNTERERKHVLRRFMEEKNKTIRLFTKEADTNPQEEDMGDALERFRAFHQEAPVQKEVEIKTNDLILEMGYFLQKVDY